MKKMAMMAALALLMGASLQAAPEKTVAGAAPGGSSPFATDAYPGFDGLDDIKKPERREKSWWFGVKRDTSAEQYTYAKDLESNGDFKGAAKAFDALVREWPSALEAPPSQLRFAKILATKLEDYEEAFIQLEYLFDFYSRDCDYQALIKYGYQLVNTMVDKKKTIFGFSFLSNRLVRQHYESLVRRAPGADFVPEAMLKIAQLRVDEQQYLEAQAVLAALQSKYPLRPEARTAAFREAEVRMWLCRRLAYNQVRCKDSLSYLRFLMKRYPDLEQMEDVKKWEQELVEYMAEEAYQHAKTYDSRRRTRHAAISAWQTFLKDYPNTSHTEEVKARIAEIAAASATK